MSLWKKFIASLALLVGLSPAVVYAQGFGAPGAGAAGAAPGVGAAAGAAPAAAGAAPKNLFSFLCMSPEQKAACKAKLCRSPLGQLLNNSLQPIGMFSGGIIGPFCPEVTPEDLAKPPTSAEGAAARAKADAAAAKERREAVRYLGTLDCRYWPEAEAALINSLRADRSECVRLEAAIALNRGCCCTKNIIKALALTVTSGTDDGNPPECSARVKAIARMALERCLACYVDITPVPEPKPLEELGKPKKKKNQGENPETGEDPDNGDEQGDDEKKPLVGSARRRAQSDSYYQRVRSISRDELIGDARKALGNIRPVSVQRPVRTRQEQSLVGLFHQASETRPAPTQRQVTVAPTRTQVKVVPTPTRVAPIPTRVTPTQRANFVPQQVPPARTNLVKPRSMATPQPTKWTRPQPTAKVMVPTPKVATPAASAKQVSPVMYRRPAQQTRSTTPTVTQLLQTLTSAMEPRHRTWAAHMLSAYDGSANPHIVQALVNSAHRDDSPATRMACLRSLVRLNVRSNAVLTVIQGLKSDSDPYVRQEALRAYQALSGKDVTASAR